MLTLSICVIILPLFVDLTPDIAVKYSVNK